MQRKHETPYTNHINTQTCLVTAAIWVSKINELQYVWFKYVQETLQANEHKPVC